MPLSNEIVPNLALTGTELAEIIQKDLASILARDGMFTPYVGYGRVSYTVIVKLHLDNFNYPEHETRTRVRPQGLVEGDVPLKDPSPEALELEAIRARIIDSPNATRIENGMPVKTQSYQDGRVLDRELRYEASEAPAGRVKDSVHKKRGGKQIDPVSGVEIEAN